LKRILITGGAGFVGSSLAILIKKNYPEYELCAMDNLKRRGSELNLPRLFQAGIKFIHGDIRNKEDFNEIPPVDCVIEASAEPSVLAGLNSPPDYLINTNLNGTVHCLNFASKHKADFIFLSTSRIYPIAAIEQIQVEEKETRFEITADPGVFGCTQSGLTEKFPLEGARSLYGATKLSSELLIHEYQYFYGIRTVINRCGVLTGPYQMGKIDQGVIVLWVARHFWKQQLGYFGYGGEGKQVRDILHVDDLYRLVDLQMHNMDRYSGEVFNVGGGREVSVSLAELTELCVKTTGNRIPMQKVPENRQADIRIYLTDNSKVTAATGWRPEISPLQIVEEITEWIKNNAKQLESILK